MKKGWKVIRRLPILFYECICLDFAVWQLFKVKEFFDYGSIVSSPVCRNSSAISKVITKELPAR